MAKIKVWCLLIDHEKKATRGNQFGVKVPADADIDDLTKAIKQERPDALQHVAPATLTVWRCTDPKLLSTMNGTQLEEKLRDIDLTDVTKAKELAAGEAIKDLGLSDGVLLLVQLPAPVGLGKHTRGDEGNDAEIAHFRKARVATEASSALALKYPSIQKDEEERILDDAPTADIDVPPVSLLFSGFGEFLDIFRAYNGLPLEVGDMARQYCHLTIDEFAEKMCRIYQDEAQRQSACLGALNKIIKTYGITEMIFQPGFVHSNLASSDGHIRTTRDTLGSVVEVKNNGTGSKTIHIQLASYAAHRRGEALQDPKNVPLRWRAPCLGLTVVDSWIGFYAIVFLGAKTHIVSLTPWLSCFPSAGEGDQRNTLYAAFAAACVLIRRIIDDAKEPDVNRHASPLFPSISCLPIVNDPSNGSFSFRIVERFGVEYFGSLRHSHLLYLAETGDSQRIIVKFSRQYSTELHKFCANRGHALKLLGYRILPGGWFVVAMDFISSAQHLAQAKIAPALQDKLKEELRSLVASFHAEGLVHGDLRGPNILYDGKTVMLVDFDWGGRDGEVSYPTLQLCKELLIDRTTSDLRIQKEDDVRVLKRTLDGI